VIGPVLRYGRVSSTQDVLLSLLEAGEVSLGAVVVAEEQEAGRGRRGRRWRSPPGGLYVSILMLSDPLCSLLAGLAVARALRDEGIDARLKWPNDVLIGEKKIGGILVEAARGWARVGIGVNVTTTPLSTATSASAEAGREISREALLERTLRYLDRGEEGVVPSYRELCTTIGRRVLVESGAGPTRRRLTGLARGVDPLGRLLVEAEAGVVAISAGTCHHLSLDEQGVADYGRGDRRKEEGGRMTVIDEAIALEGRARTMYVEAKARMRDASAKEILDLLAREEEKHAEALQALKEQGVGNLPSSFLLEEVRGLVEGAAERGEAAISREASLRDVLVRAMEMEKATERFYREHAGQAAEPNLRGVFVRLAGAEEGHYLVCSSLAEYFDRPAAWVESAEFGLRPDY